MSSPTLNLFADASGQAGYGAVLGQEWFYGAWDERWLGQNITLLELCPIVMAVKVWGPSLAHNCISFHTDNMALVEMINKQSSKESSTIALAMFALAFHAFLRVGEITVSNNTLPNPNLLQREQLVLGEQFFVSNLPRIQTQHRPTIHPFKVDAGTRAADCPVTLMAQILVQARFYPRPTVHGHPKPTGVEGPNLTNIYAGPWLSITAGSAGPWWRWQPPPTTLVHAEANPPPRNGGRGESSECTDLTPRIPPTIRPKLPRQDNHETGIANVPDHVPRRVLRP
ncbi:hypothetical protein BaRGS_00031740 [Batillaria attramentaria]|uniref:RNase H type-1 domain-containing protein n=1 Tax=Batillaria attramentaria TaxID=370345 RepID=A0ABD0JQT4_9CAEN